MIGYETRDTDTKHNVKCQSSNAKCQSPNGEISGRAEKRALSGMGFEQQPIVGRGAPFPEILGHFGSKGEFGQQTKRH